MECGSDYVWLPDKDSETVSEVAQTNYSENLFAQDVFADAPVQQQASTAPAAPHSSFSFASAPAQKRRVVRQADTNVISVSFTNLLEEAHISTGDCVFCTSCNAAFNSMSKIDTIQSKEEGKSDQIWACEFCGEKNSVSIDDEEIPKAPIMDYVVGSVKQSKVSSDDNLIIFCIDTSGSMSVSYEIEGKHSFKGEEKVKKLEALNTERNAYGNLADQFLPHERRDITYVTRLQCVQAAIDAQLQKMKLESPNSKVGIVTFNSEISIMGDATNAAQVVAGDKLSNYDQLLSIGKEYSVNKKISESCDSLQAKLFSLEEGGATALGPALLTAVGMCSNSNPGSSIVICTDGLSNIGLGSLDDLHTEEQKDVAGQFYEQVGIFAKSKGIIISVVSIKGTDCSIENLGALSELTSGNVDRVDPINLAKNFSSILSLPVIAFNVSVDIHIHKGLYIRGDVEQNLENENQHSKRVKDIGNVTKETTSTFEYGVRADVNKEELNKLKTLPFQLKIRYTKLDGMKCMRVITKFQEITTDRKVAEEHANIDVLGTNAVQQVAKFARRGSYEEARLYNIQNNRLFQRTADSSKSMEVHSKVKAWTNVQQGFESEMTNVKKREAEKGLFYDEDEEDEMNMEEKKESKEKSKSKKKSVARKTARSDSTANMLYQMKSLNPSSISKKNENEEK